MTLTIPDITPEMGNLDAALAYANAGWYLVPVNTNHPDPTKRKSPGSVVGGDWPALSSRDPRQITAWFAGTDYGIALHCGRSGAVVLDVDAYDNVPDEVLAAIETTDCPYQSTRPDQPGRGHYLLANTTGRRISNILGKLATTPKWGEVRGANGVIIAAPSVHPEAGGSYRWQRTGALPPVPDYVADALPESSTPDDTATDAEIRHFLDAHTRSDKPEALNGLITALTNKLAQGHSCHQSTLGIVTDAMAEAAAGLYPARTARDQLWPVYLNTATTGTSTGRVLTNADAKHQYRGIVAWAIGQAPGKADQARERVTDRFPDAVTEVGAEEFGDIDAQGEAEATTWEPIDLGPWLSGDITSPQPTVGISRSDGQKLLYAGREHTVFGETEAGKSWFALECCAVEIRMGRDVVYIHYEESDPASTIERLRLLAVTPAQIAKHLRFAAPLRPARPGWLTELLNPAPALVVHDGVNEAMSLHGDDTNAADGAATFRRTIIKPCLAVGAATLSCDHVTKGGGDNRGRYAIGSAHKVNAIDGAAFLMENIEPFGRGLRGASSVYVTKDRPGQLRSTGKPGGVAGKTLIGVLTVDATPEAGPEFLNLWAPKDGDDRQDDDAVKKGATLAEIGQMLYGIVAAEPDGTVKSRRDLFAKMRDAGNLFRDELMRNAADMLVVSGQLVEIPGRRGGTGYKTRASASQTPDQNNSDLTASQSASRTASPLGGDAVGRTWNRSASSASDAVGRSGTQSGTDDEKAN